MTIRARGSATGCMAMKTASLIQTTHSNVAGAALSYKPIMHGDFCMRLMIVL